MNRSAEYIGGPRKYRCESRGRSTLTGVDVLGRGRRTRSANAAVPGLARAETRLHAGLRRLNGVAAERREEERRLLRVELTVVRCKCVRRQDWVPVPGRSRREDGRGWPCTREHEGVPQTICVSRFFLLGGVQRASCAGVRLPRMLWGSCWPAWGWAHGRGRSVTVKPERMSACIPWVSTSSARGVGGGRLCFTLAQSGGGARVALAAMVQHREAAANWGIILFVSPAAGRAYM
ncbi:hypothetical protein DFH06DRAFT_1144034 [Mycena polygramma]|nr:hypothetical protein DFH06DRAFT_1144034 [Mycena polygramma]